MQDDGEYRQVLAPYSPEHHVTRLAAADQHEVTRGGRLCVVAVEVQLCPRECGLYDLWISADPGSARQGGPRQVGNERRGCVEGSELQPGVEQHDAPAG